MSGCSVEPSNGVISTGNAGRILGAATFDNHGVEIAARLVMTRTGSDSLIDSLRTDTSGTFEFKNVASGTYRIEAWSEGKLQGKSGEFKVDRNLVKDIIVVLVQPVRYLLDASMLGQVDSMFLDYPGNPAFKQGSLWSVQGLKGTSGTLFTRIKNSNGETNWLAWEIQPVGDTLKIVGVSNSPSAVYVRKIDTSAFFISPHTVALWTFDSLPSQGIFRDLSEFRNDLLAPAGTQIRSTPHGNGLYAGSLQSNNPLSTSGSILPAALRWTKTGMQTWEMRVKLEKEALDGFIFLGSYVGPEIGMNGSRAIGIYQQAITERGNAWFGVLSEPNVIPIGRWVNIAVAIDQSHNDFYLWIDGRPVQLYPAYDVTSLGMVADTTRPFNVGGAAWDARVGPFLLDEVRISDTLVFGQGLPTQPASVYKMSPTTIGTSSTGSCSDCQSFSICNTGRSGTGYLILQPNLPAALNGKRSVSSRMLIWSAEEPGNQRFLAYRLLKPAETVAMVRPAPVAGVDYEATPFTVGVAQAGSTGGISFDASQAAKDWLEHPETAYGIIVKSADSLAAPFSVFTSSTSTPQKAPSIEIHYR
jgi:hypothetical protein